MVLRSDGHTFYRAKAQLGRGASVAQSFATAFYNSAAWERCRKSYLIKPLSTPLGIVPPGMCERCFWRGELIPAKIVHHKVHLTPQNVTDPETTLNHDNLQRLCQDCHAFVHSSQDEPRVVFDDQGNAHPARRETPESLVMQLTETIDERRNIHRSEAHG